MIVLLLCLVPIFTIIVFNIWVYYKFLKWEQTIDKDKYTITKYDVKMVNGKEVLEPSSVYTRSIALTEFISNKLYLSKK